ncbi:MAG TPA: group I intron-associated PD-(D/E)XK endonuclease [Candidatus Acidoferrum sp.]|nr:group I intron-associated PD-(D/E)XK endonuclease [Candidatus Acidoferrum sp.]
MKRDTKKIGAVSELMVMAALVRAGYRLAIPFGDSSRYDVIIEDEVGRLARVQIKTGRLRNGAIEFNGYSSHSHRGGVSTRSYVGEVELFGVYCPQSDRCFLVPADMVRTHGSLRVEQARNGQSKGINWAEAFALPGAPKKVVGASALGVVPLAGELPL